jgi:hypothetical protein
MIVEALSILSETVRDCMSRIGYTLKALKRIPHALASELEQTQLTMYRQLLLKLEGWAHNNWRHHITEDESLFYYESG